MPTSSNASALDKKRTLKVVNKILTPSGSSESTKHKQRNSSQIAPQTAVITRQNHDANSVTLQTKSDGTVCVLRSDKEIKIDRLNLDRCSLSKIPIVVDDNIHLRLFSLQHNLIANLIISQEFPNLVFLDVYDNEIELIGNISMMIQLRVFLIGKNRLRKITGLSKLIKLEVLDLHGNQISQVTGLNGLCKLKVLNLAGNRINSITEGDLKGLDSLLELNLRRNCLKKIRGFDDISSLQKLFISNNEIKRIDDMITIIKCLHLKELTMENNPVSVTSDCVSFLVAQLSSLTLVNGIQVTENFRKTALVWKRNKLQALKSNPLNGGREKVISNAKTNWELLRTQTKSLTAKENRSQLKSGSKSMPSLKSRFNFPRTNSLDTTESSSLSNSEYVCLPPIIIATGRRSTGNLDAETSSVVSSNDPHVDSSVESLHLDGTSSESSSESKCTNVQVAADDVETTGAVASTEDDSIEKKICDNVGSSGSSSCLTENVIITSSDGTGSELSHSNSSIKSRRNIKSAFAATNLIRGRLVRRPIHTRATSVKVSKSRSPSTGSSSGFGNAGTIITYQGTPAVSSGSSGGVSALGPTARDKEQGGDYLVEICGRHLNVYGQGAMRHLDKPWSPSKAADVTHVNFHYANYNGIAVVLPRLKHRFPHVAHLSFTGNGLTNLGQINALAELQGLNSIFIHEEGNPLVMGNSKWRQYAIYRLGHWGLKSINGEEITNDEDLQANIEFRSLSDLVLYTLPDSILEPLLSHLKLDSDDLVSERFSKKNLLLADPNLRSVITKEALQWKRSANSQDEFALRQRSKARISAIVDEMVHSQMKLRELEKTWTQIWKDIIQNSLLDYTQFETYKKLKLQELM